DGDDWVNVGNPHDLVITEAISIACWVNPTGFVGRQGFVGLFMGYAFKVHELGQLCFTTPRFLDHESANTILEAGTWQHVAVTFQPGQNNGVVFYLNGVETDRLNSSAMDPGSGPFLIGSNQWGETFTGMIDDVRVYNHLLTKSEVPAAMKGGEGYPYASNPYPADGALYQDTWVDLSWFAGGTAVSHNVYFGDNFDDVNDGAEGTFRGNQAKTFFIAGFPGFPYPDGLVPGTTYYWRIDEVDDTEPNSPWKGNVWSFSILPNATYAPGHFTITYYDNYNYDTGQWDAWQGDATPRDAWDDKYLADGSSGKTVFTDHAFTSITAFDLRGGLVSKERHASDGEDWNPLRSIGDNVSGQSAHHVFAALFKGLIYLEEGDNLMVASDDDVYVFLDGDTAWGQEVLSIPSVSHFGTDSMTVTAAQAGYHTITVKYIERLNIHSGIEITLNGRHLQNAEIVIDIDKDFEYVPQGWPLGLWPSQTPAVGLSTEPYEALGKEPEYGSGQVLYGYIPLGNSNDSNISFAVDTSSINNWLLYVDTNNNEDLTDDGPPRENEGTGTLAATISLQVEIISASGETIIRPYQLWLWITASGSPRFYAVCHYRSQISIGEEQYTAIVYESRNHDALYQESGLWIDLNRDGKLVMNTSEEHFQDGAVISIEGKEYVLRLDYP
ncbi:MAG: LamG domain-containing protein, partial [Planctomycetota bacterium]